MKKRIISLIFVIIFSFTIISRNRIIGYSDGLTISMVSAGAMALGESLGFSLSMTSGNTSVMDEWYQKQITTYLNGRQLTDVFGSEPLKAVAGKLAIGQLAYNGLLQFFEWMKGTKTTEKDIIVSSIYLPMGYDVTGTYMQIKQQCPPVGFGTFGNVTIEHDNYTFYIKQAGSIKASGTYHDDGIFFFRCYSSNPSRVYFFYAKSANDNDLYEQNYAQLSYSTYGTMSVGDLSGTGAIDPGYEWQGDMGLGIDTNLDQIMSSIKNNAFEGDLSVTGEIVEPAPAPTPVPTFEPYPPVDDILPGINTGIEIGNDLIVGQQAQTGAITQGLEGVQDAVGSLEGTIEAIADTPTAEELPDFKFDLRDLFPFCIPFDIYRLLSSFDAEPVAPHVQLPIVIDSINFRYNLDLDFSAWNPVAQAMRTAELIVYAIALAWATGKVIKW